MERRACAACSASSWRCSKLSVIQPCSFHRHFILLTSLLNSLKRLTMATSEATTLTTSSPPTTSSSSTPHTPPGPAQLLQTMVQDSVRQTMETAMSGVLASVQTSIRTAIAGQPTPIPSKSPKLLYHPLRQHPWVGMSVKLRVGRVGEPGSNWAAPPTTLT